MNTKIFSVVILLGVASNAMAKCDAVNPCTAAEWQTELQEIAEWQKQDQTYHERYLEQRNTLRGLSSDPYGQQQYQQQLYQTDSYYRQQRNQQMILNHGAGGCTPNFATGGCL